MEAAAVLGGVSFHDVFSLFTCVGMRESLILNEANTSAGAFPQEHTCEHKALLLCGSDHLPTRVWYQCVRCLQVRFLLQVLWNVFPVFEIQRPRVVTFI